MNISELLGRAATLIEQPYHYCPQGWGEDSFGNPVGFAQPFVFAFSARHAVMWVARGDMKFAAQGFKFIEEVTGTRWMDYLTDESITHDQMLETFQLAIEAAKDFELADAESIETETQEKPLQEHEDGSTTDEQETDSQPGADEQAPTATDGGGTTRKRSR